ncbi:MAG: acyl carrier protein [Propionibacteriaceae bacterium]|nr:acyl carrier protein [Propionibacteriaceae bacterium]
MEQENFTQNTASPPGAARSYELVTIAPPDPREEVVEVLRNSLAAVIGPEAMALLHVTADTRLFKDLGLDSIEFVQVAEKVQSYYGVDTQFVMDKVSQIPLRKMMKLTVGDVVDLIADGLRDGLR